MLRRQLLLWRLDLLPFLLLCPVRLTDSSVRKGSPSPVDVVAAARPALGLAVRARNDLGNAPLPLVALLVAGRSPIGLLRVLLKKIEPSLLLPPLDVRMEVHLAIHAPVQLVTARPVLAAVVVRCSGAVSLRLWRSSVLPFSG